MSYINEVWNGRTSDRSNEFEDSCFDSDIAMNENYLRDDHVFYESKLRWNKNTKQGRVNICWDCGKETDEYYCHKWRTQDGKIAMYKCDECYEKYLENKKK